MQGVELALRTLNELRVAPVEGPATAVAAAEEEEEIVAGETGPDTL